MATGRQQVRKAPGALARKGETQTNPNPEIENEEDDDDLTTPEDDQDSPETPSDNDTPADTPEDADKPAEDESAGDEAAADSGSLTQEEMDATDFRSFWLEFLENSNVAPPKDGRLVFPGEPITFTGEKHGTTVVQDRPIYRMFVPFRSKRPSFTLEVPKGMRVNAARSFSKAAYLERVGRLYEELTEED